MEKETISDFTLSMIDLKENDVLTALLEINRELEVGRDSSYIRRTTSEMRKLYETKRMLKNILINDFDYGDGY